MVSMKAFNARESWIIILEGQSSGHKNGLHHKKGLHNLEGPIL